MLMASKIFPEILSKKLPLVQSRNFTEQNRNFKLICLKLEVLSLRTKRREANCLTYLKLGIIF